jgi:hypothetical protein
VSLVRPEAAVNVAFAGGDRNGVTLNAGQVALVRQMDTSGGRLQLAIASAGACKATALTRPGGRADPRPASRGAAACTDGSEGRPWPR